MGQVIVLGVFVADTAYRADRMPRMGETILGKSFALGPGGKGSNQAVAVGKLGAEVSIISRLGEDDFAQMALQTWRAANVTPKVITDASSYTGAAYIFIDDNTGISDMVMDPDNSRILFAGAWQLDLKTWRRISGGPGSGIFKS